MKRKNFYLTNEQDDILRKFSKITVSEHIRRALDLYIKDLLAKGVSSSVSK